ncbi:MAG: PP2C family serine/threonine-protein phosphatase [Fimbriiglobus sp.]
MIPQAQEEEYVQAVRWRLGLSCEGKLTPDELKRTWNTISLNDALLQSIIRQLARPLQHALYTKLTGVHTDQHHWSEPLADVLLNWVKANPSQSSPKISGAIRDGLRSPSKPATATKPTGLHKDAGKNLPPLPTNPPVPVNPPPPQAVNVPPRLPTVQPPPLPPPPVAKPLPTPTGWRYLPVPESPEPYPEETAQEFPNPQAGFRGFGANVRGKKHKHDGTNCDDAYAFCREGNWTIIAVSDGAGSKKLSRIGARAAVTAAVETLRKMPGYDYPLERSIPDWGVALAAASGEVAKVHEALIEAMQNALAAVRVESSSRMGNFEIENHLVRLPELNDFSCTLLLAVMHPVLVESSWKHLVAACQVGDGMVGVIHRDGRPIVLGAADSGSHAGETEFLTSSGKTEPEFLRTKISVTLTDLQALLVMTDGVADDYFPADAQLPRLWGDLVVNGIPDLKTPTGAIADERQYGIEVELVKPDPRPIQTLHSCETFAGLVGTSPVELVKSPEALWAGRRPLPGDTASERLKLWLDAYTMRGSFDDRTLVCVHREDFA